MHEPRILGGATAVRDTAKVDLHEMTEGPQLSRTQAEATTDATTKFSDNTTKQQQSRGSDKTFFDLPGELRNKIYELALGRPRLVVVVAPDRDLASLLSANLTYDRYERHVPLVRPVQRRHQWEHVIDRGPVELRPGALASYELHHSDERFCPEHGRNLNLLLANKQVYHEAASLFYDDTVVFDVPRQSFTMAPNAFIMDHPMAAEFLNSVHLILRLPPASEHTDLSYDGSVTMWTAAEAEPPFGMFELVEQLSKINLRHLGLSINGTVPFHRNRSDHKSHIQTCWWMKKLCTLGRLESIFLEIISGPFYYGSKSTIPDTIEFCWVMELELLGNLTAPLPMEVYKLTSADSWRPAVLWVTFGHRKHEEPSLGKSARGPARYVRNNISDWEDRKEEVFDPSFWDLE